MQIQKYKIRLISDVIFSIIRHVNTATKLLDAMRRNPLDWHMEQLLTVAAKHGLEVCSHGGSHHVFSHPDLVDTLSVPAHKPIKPLYVKRFCALIDQL